MTKPRVAVIGTGGTISPLARDRLDVWESMDFGQKIGPQDVVERFPEMTAAAEIVPVTVRMLSILRVSPQLASARSRSPR
jgi:L-asparaginase